MAGWYQRAEEAARSIKVPDNLIDTVIDARLNAT